MIENESAGAVMLSNDNKVLVVSQHGTSWSLIKGTVEEGEEPGDTLPREVNEESGITEFKMIRELGVYKRNQLNKDGSANEAVLKTITIFLCTTNETEIVPIDSENPEAIWVAIDEVEELLTHPKDKEFYKSVVPNITRFVDSR